MPRDNHAGHTCEEIYNLRHGSFARVPDVVVWPENHAHCETIVAAAIKHNVVIIPFGGRFFVWAKLNTLM